MINYAKRKECIDEIRAVCANPIKSIQLLKELKHGDIPTYKFVGYLKYYLKIAGRDLSPITTFDLGRSRRARQSLLLLQLEECWKLGFVNDTQYALCRCAINAINLLIKRYLLIYIFL